ncbi:MAG TPA: alpha/beta hydrolase, partial [Phaeodactylibacter sp.]|nr:alpha/beta hydrolase [Phaeodactylibacter sp.]
MIKTSKILRAVIILLISFNFSCAQRGEFEPPKGYWNQFTMKIAYATGRLKLIDPSPEIPNNLIAYRDLVYKKTKEKILKLDLYHKNNITQPTPLLVFIHGGSWKSGDKDDYRRYLVDFAEKGYITATIAYRFSQEAPFPAAFDDVVCAIKWLKDHASAYHVDTENIAVIGGSAGGHLA